MEAASHDDPASQLVPLSPEVDDELDVALSEEPAPTGAPETASNPGADTIELQNIAIGANQQPFPQQLARPGLRRGQSVPEPAPSPQHLPPPASPSSLEPGNPTDSLSLAQLRRLVNELPRVEPTPYAFVYEDSQSLPEELEEWFSYSVEEQAMILKTQSSFAEEWGNYTGWNIQDSPQSMNAQYMNGEADWTMEDKNVRTAAIGKLLAHVRESGTADRLKAVEALTYLALGCYFETAGVESESQRRPISQQDDQASSTESVKTFAHSAVQFEWILSNSLALLQAGGVQTIFDALRDLLRRACGATPRAPDAASAREGKEAERRELWCELTLMYVFLEVARWKKATTEHRLAMREAIGNLQPTLLVTLVEIIEHLRWDDSIELPQTKILLLTWKAILVTFGGLDEVDRVKAFFRDPTLETTDPRGRPIITASPLDYHLFRQEISSKYPAYNPPPPLFPLEPDNTSILPPLKDHPSRTTGSIVFGSGLSNRTNGASILHQPVHIATPAPSPPPSPAGPGGKGGKKQNYQTNQLFPFLYPPLDASSNNLGGKGSTDLQDVLVGRRWEGSDIPASILEAAELFAQRMRATRAMKQLWEERVLFMKYDRGWTSADDDEDVEPLELDRMRDQSPKGTRREEEDPEKIWVDSRLQAVEDFYKASLPHLQSLVIVLLKSILANITTLLTQPNGPNNPQQPNFQDANPNKAEAANGVNGVADGANLSLEDVDVIRIGEINAKAVSALLILLLKWFKVCHVLKFEYLTQLLVDSNYMPLVLKLFQMQELERVVNYRCDREDLNFFQFCLAHSRSGPPIPEPPQVEDSDSDDAVPPPISRYRPDDPRFQPPPEDQQQPAGPSAPPEVDELGIPTTALPATPITNFSWRAFFAVINLLRALQKLCKNKAHRNLLMVQYKSSPFLKKILKVPQPELRLYTLKLFKNQVPYCGRKWRQSNMRVITAVYLHCRPELRDDWLAGSDVDAEVEDSVPQEQALRALTHWYNLRQYPEAMGVKAGVLDSEQDFFRRELERLWKLQVGQQQQEQQESEEQGWDGVGGLGQVEGW